MIIFHIIIISGPARLVQVMLPLVRRARGRVVLASSILTHVAAPVRGVHAASLAALDALAACLRRELKPRGVDVVSMQIFRFIQ